MDDLNRLATRRAQKRRERLPDTGRMGIRQGVVYTNREPISPSYFFFLHQPALFYRCLAIGSLN